MVRNWIYCDEVLNGSIIRVYWVKGNDCNKETGSLTDFLFLRMKGGNKYILKVQQIFVNCLFNISNMVKEHDKYTDLSENN